MSDNLPKAVWEGEMQIGNMALRIAVLDNGERIILAESLYAFLAAMEDGSLSFTQEESDRLASWLKGK